MQKSSSQYDSFLFWRQPIAAPDLTELDDITVTHSLPANSSKAKVKMMSSGRAQDEQVVLPEFSSFNYWRAPICEVDSLLKDLNLLL